MNVLPPPISATASASGRLTWLDSLKGLVILLVVFGHTTAPTESLVDLYGMEGDFRLTVFLSGAIWSFHMPLFMLISGIVFSKAFVDEDWKPKTGKILRQMLNMAIVYFLFCYIFAGFKVALSGIMARQITLYDVLAVPVRPLFGMWYLNAYVVLYAVAFFCLRCFKKGWVWILPMAVAAKMLTYGVWSAYVWTDILRIAPFFFLGCIWRDAAKYRWPLAVSCLVAAAVGYMDNEAMSALFVALCMSAFALQAFSTVQALDCPFLRFLGRYTLEIYIIHPYAIAVLRRAMHAMGGLPELLWLSTAFVVATLITMGVVWILERIGLRNILFRPVKWYEARRAQRAN